VDHLDRQSRATQSLDQYFLVAAGRLDRDADDLLFGAKPRNASKLKPPTSMPMKIWL
jgi:hypothetical protein